MSAEIDKPPPRLMLTAGPVIKLQLDHFDNVLCDLLSEVGARKTEGSGKQRIIDVDVDELVALFDVEDQTELKQRVGSKPKLYAKLLGGARRIAALFHGRPRLTFEPAAIVVRIQTKLEADEADRLYDQLLDTWWLANVHVED